MRLLLSFICARHVAGWNAGLPTAPPNERECRSLFVLAEIDLEGDEPSKPVEMDAIPRSTSASPR